MVSFPTWVVWTYSSVSTIKGLCNDDTVITTFTSNYTCPGGGIINLYQKRPDPDNPTQTGAPIYAVWKT